MNCDTKSSYCLPLSVPLPFNLAGRPLPLSSLTLAFPRPLPFTAKPSVTSCSLVTSTPRVPAHVWTRLNSSTPGDIPNCTSLENWTSLLCKTVNGTGMSPSQSQVLLLLSWLPLLCYKWVHCTTWPEIRFQRGFGQWLQLVGCTNLLLWVWVFP